MGAGTIDEDFADETRPIAPGAGSARSALRHPTFRRVFVGAFLSNIGNWMQMVVLGGLAYHLSGSSTFVGVMVFAQLGPLLLLSPVGGLMADRFDRRRLLMIVTGTQLGLSLALAAIALSDNPNKVALVGVVFAIGMGQAVYGPTYSSLLPQLVDRDDLAGAVSLNSTQMNLSRVIGPAIGGVLNSLVGASAVFVGNAASYLFVIGALLTVQLPAPIVDHTASKGIRALGDGFRIARRDPVVWRCLVILFWFSLISLPFVGQFPVLAERNLGIDSQSIPYGVLYACFGLGAALGSLSVGTVFNRHDNARITRISLIGFAAALSLFAVLRSPTPAYPVAVLVGFAYFALITALAVVLQERLADRERGRVMALWIMAFGGTVPIGNLLAGPLIDRTSVTTVILVGAAFALALTGYARLDRDRDRKKHGAAVSTTATTPATATACAGR
ncbi:MAG TPA: MFS transporter [Acidimicrobiales bacterium]|jgi:predicted MFS family arabinose efflux permease